MTQSQGVLTGQTDLLMELALWGIAEHPLQQELLEPFRILILKRVILTKVTQMMILEIWQKVMSFLTLKMFVMIVMRNMIYQYDNVKIVL